MYYIVKKPGLFSTVVSVECLMSCHRIFRVDSPRTDLKPSADFSTHRCLEERRADDSPKTVLAGTDSLLSQKDTWDRMTVMMQGRYVWITK